MAKNQSVSEALTMTSAASPTSQAIVVTLARAKNEPDATDDSGASLTTGSVLTYGREPALSDTPSMPVLGPGAGPGGGPGRISSVDDSGPTPALELTREAERFSRMKTAASLASRKKTRKATALNLKESQPLPTRAPLKPRTKQPSYPPRGPASRPTSPRIPAVSKLRSKLYWKPRLRPPIFSPFALRPAACGLRSAPGVPHPAPCTSLRTSQDCRAVAGEGGLLIRHTALVLVSQTSDLGSPTSDLGPRSSDHWPFTINDFPNND